MKRYILLIVIAVAAVGLAAQQGLFGLSFGEELARADSLMSQQGFVAWDVEGTLVKYASDYNNLVESVVLFVIPSAEVVVGWFVRYSDDNTAQQDKFVIDNLHRMHGEEVIVDKDSGKITWSFDEARSVTAAYDALGSLCVYYFDADFAEFFELPGSAKAGSSTENYSRE